MAVFFVSSIRSMARILLCVGWNWESGMKKLRCNWYFQVCVHGPVSLICLKRIKWVRSWWLNFHFQPDYLTTWVIELDSLHLRLSKFISNHGTRETTWLFEHSSTNDWYTTLAALSKCPRRSFVNFQICLLSGYKQFALKLTKQWFLVSHDQKLNGSNLDIDDPFLRH